MGRRRVVGVAFAGLATLAFGQQPSITVPDGPRHFIVLVDSSFSMAADSQRPAPRGLKRASLTKAEGVLTSLLYDKGRVLPGQPWYRPGTDLISVLHYGIDTKPRADLAYLRLKFARLTDDYIRPATLHDTNLQRARFRRLLRPPFRTQLNVLAWALPLGMSAAAVGAETQIQNTTVILLNDAQMNDGSMVLEDFTLSRHLPAEARQRLRTAQRAVREDVRLTDANGEPGELFEYAFGEDRDQVVITGFRAEPKRPKVQGFGGPPDKGSGAQGFEGSRVMENLGLGWQPGGLGVRFGVAEGLRGDRARVLGFYGSGVLGNGQELTLRNQNEVLLPNVPQTAGQATLRLGIEQKSVNVLLGTQRYFVNFDRPVLLPDPPDTAAAKLRWGLALAIAGLAALGIAAWCLYQRYVARHFRLWLADYSEPFILAPLSQGDTARFVTRAPTGDGEAIAYLELPHPIIVSMFYRKAVLAWDERLTAAGNSGAEAPHSIALRARKSRFVPLIWSNRPKSGGELDVSLERPKRNGRHDRIQIIVRFFARHEL